MTASREDIQSFIERLEAGVVSGKELKKGIWVLTPEGDTAQIVVDYEPPLVVVRVNVMELPPEGPRRHELMKRLLELNATDLVHGSYGIEGSSVVLTDALQLENLNFNEFQASIESLILALGSHLSALASYQE